MSIELAVKQLELKLKKLNDTSYDSIDSLMRTLMRKYDVTAKELHHAFVNKHHQTPDEWIHSLKEGTLHQWFKGSKSKDGKPGWVQADGSPCANEPGETKTPKCFSSGRLRALRRKGEKGKALIRSAVRRKRKKDKGQQQKSGAARPTYVGTFAKGKKDPNYIKAEPGIRESMEILEAQKDRPGKGSGTKDACYYKVKSRFKVWPSAYGSAALVRCRKKGVKNWGTTTEETMPKEEKRYCSLCDKRETRSECSYGGEAWDKYTTKDHEYSMARSELSTIENAVRRLKKRIGKGEGNLEAWVQSKITRAADYIDTVADYVDSGEMNESSSFGFTIDPEQHKKEQKKAKASKIAARGATPGERDSGTGAVKRLGGTGAQLLNIKKEDILVNKILDDIYEQGIATLLDANGKPFVDVIDLIDPEPIKGFKSQVEESTRIQSQNGNVLMVTVNWRGKYYFLKMFFPQVRMPSRKEVQDELEKVYPGGKVMNYVVSDFTPGAPMIQTMNGGNGGKPGPNKNYIKPMGESYESEEYGDLEENVNKTKMKCNSPKASPHGHGESGKSHIVKACEGGKEKILRFGQLGVKGSPKKKGESKAYASRRHRFQTRHAKNIKKGKMSAAYWANKVKW